MDGLIDGLIVWLTMSDKAWNALQLFHLQTALRDANIAIYGGERSCKYLSLPKAPSPRHEYGTAALTLELVESMDDAIDHLHANGSGHTECIVTGEYNCQSQAASGYRGSRHDAYRHRLFFSFLSFLAQATANALSPVSTIWTVHKGHVWNA